VSRIRSIHPGLWTDEAFVSLSPFARLLFMGVWNECDDMGSFEWAPLKLKMRLLPADAVDAAGLLAELSDVGAVIRYEHGGKPYGAVRNFCQYQRPKKPNSVYPQTEEVRAWVNTGARSTRDGEQAVPHQLPTGGEKSRQMEEEGGDKETSSGKPEGSKARKRAASAPDKPKFEVPDWIPAEPWQAFVDMRRALEAGPKKIAFTVGAAKGIVAELEKFRDQGHDIGAILMKSAINSYRGVFAPDKPAEPAFPAAHVTDQAAYLAEIANKPWMQNRDTPPPVPDRRNGNTGPPRSFGALAAGIAGNA
jgi:hypothetical protein